MRKVSVNELIAMFDLAKGVITEIWNLDDLSDEYRIYLSDLFHSIKKYEIELYSIIDDNRFIVRKLILEKFKDYTTADEFEDIIISILERKKDKTATRKELLEEIRKIHRFKIGDWYKNGNNQIRWHYQVSNALERLKWKGIVENVAFGVWRLKKLN